MMEQVLADRIALQALLKLRQLRFRARVKADRPVEGDEGLSDRYFQGSHDHESVWKAPSDRPRTAGTTRSSRTSSGAASTTSQREPSNLFSEYQLLLKRCSIGRQCFLNVFNVFQIYLFLDCLYVNLFLVLEPPSVCD